MSPLHASAYERLPFFEVNEHLAGLQAAQEVGLKAARERFKFSCPTCASSDALHAYPRAGGGAYCFSCGTSFSAVDLAMAAWGLSPADACRRLADRVGIWADARGAPAQAAARPARSEEATRRLRQEVYGAIVASLTLGPQAREYLEGRGLNPDFAHVQGLRSVESVEEWRSLHAGLLAAHGAPALGAAGFGTASSPWLPWRGRVPALVLPYFARAGRGVEAMRFRRMTPGDKRYMAPVGAGTQIPWRAEAFDAPDPLELVITEGELDALTLLQSGYESVGLGGATPATAVIAWLVDASERVEKMALWTDSDRAGEGAVERLVHALVDRYGLGWTRRHVVRWRSDQDANDLALHGGLR